MNILRAVTYLISRFLGLDDLTLDQVWCDVTKCAWLHSCKPCCVGTLLYHDSYFVTVQFKAVRDVSEQVASVQEFKPEPTAEIDVELSDGDSNDLQQTTALKNKLKRESDEPLSENEHEPGAQGKPGWKL